MSPCPFPLLKPLPPEGEGSVVSRLRDFHDNLLIDNNQVHDARMSGAPTDRFEQAQATAQKALNLLVKTRILPDGYERFHSVRSDLERLLKTILQTLRSAEGARRNSCACWKPTSRPWTPPRMGRPCRPSPAPCSRPPGRPVPEPRPGQRAQRGAGRAQACPQRTRTSPTRGTQQVHPRRGLRRALWRRGIRRAAPGDGSRRRDAGRGTHPRTGGQAQAGAQTRQPGHRCLHDFGGGGHATAG